MALQSHSGDGIEDWLQPIMFGVHETSLANTYKRSNSILVLTACFVRLSCHIQLLHYTVTVSYYLSVCVCFSLWLCMYVCVSIYNESSTEIVYLTSRMLRSLKSYKCPYFIFTIVLWNFIFYCIVSNYSLVL